MIRASSDEKFVAAKRCKVFIRNSFFFHAEDGIRDDLVTGVQTCALPIWRRYSVVLPTVLLAMAGACSGTANRAEVLSCRITLGKETATAQGVVKPGSTFEGFVAGYRLHFAVLTDRKSVV